MGETEAEGVCLMVVVVSMDTQQGAFPGDPRVFPFNLPADSPALGRTLKSCELPGPSCHLHVLQEAAAALLCNDPGVPSLGLTPPPSELPTECACAPSSWEPSNTR